MRRRSGTAGIRAPGCRSCADRGLAFGRSVSAEGRLPQARPSGALPAVRSAGAGLPPYQGPKEPPLALRGQNGGVARRPAVRGPGRPTGRGRRAVPPSPRTTALHNQGLPQRACPTLGVGPRTATCRRTSPFKDLVPSFAEEWARARRLVVVQAPQASGRAPAVRGPCGAQDKASGRHARHPARPVGGYAQRLSQGGARRRKRQYAYSYPLPSPRRPAPPAPQRNLAAAARHESALYFTGVRRPRRRRRDRAPRGCPPAGT